MTIKLSLVETVMTKKLETRQLLQNKLDNFVKEGKLRSLMESKRKDFLEVEKTKKAVDAENLSIKKENEVLSVDKMKLLDTAASLKDELEVKISHLLGMDIQVAKEMEITRTRLKKDVLGMISTEEEVVKEPEAIELESKSQKAVLSENIKIEKNLAKEVTDADKEIKAAEKVLKSKVKEIDAEESRLSMMS